MAIVGWRSHVILTILSRRNLHTEKMIEVVTSTFLTMFLISPICTWGVSFGQHLGCLEPSTCISRPGWTTFILWLPLPVPRLITCRFWNHFSWHIGISGSKKAKSDNKKEHKSPFHVTFPNAYDPSETWLEKYDERQKEKKNYKFNWINQRNII